MSSDKKCTVPIAGDTPPSRTVSFNELNGSKEGARVSLSVEELALLDEIQRRGRVTSSTVSYLVLIVISSSEENYHISNFTAAWKNLMNPTWICIILRMSNNMIRKICEFEFDTGS